jgi:hypothetical protein
MTRPLSLEGRRINVSPTAHTTYRACPRKWFYAKALDIPQPETPAKQTGIDVHDLAEKWSLGLLPAVPDTAAGRIFTPLVPLLPTPGTYAVETWSKTTLHFPGIGPEYIDFVGKIDLWRWPSRDPALPPLPDYDPDTLTIKDIKTSGDPTKWGKSSTELYTDPQMLAYVAVEARNAGRKPERVDVAHLYTATRGLPHAFPSQALNVPWENVEAVWEDYEGAAREQLLMFDTDGTLIAEEKDVPCNRSACGMYGGCPYRDRCLTNQKVSVVGALANPNTAAPAAPKDPTPMPIGSPNPPDAADSTVTSGGNYDHAVRSLTLHQQYAKLEEVAVADVVDLCTQLGLPCTLAQAAVVAEASGFGSVDRKAGKDMFIYGPMPGTTKPEPQPEAKPAEAKVPPAEAPAAPAAPPAEAPALSSVPKLETKQERQLVEAFTAMGRFAPSFDEVKGYSKEHEIYGRPPTKKIKRVLEYLAAVAPTAPTEPIPEPADEPEPEPEPAEEPKAKDKKGPSIVKALKALGYTDEQVDLLNSTSVAYILEQKKHASNVSEVTPEGAAIFITTAPEKDAPVPKGFGKHATVVPPVAVTDAEMAPSVEPAPAPIYEHHPSPVVPSLQVLVNCFRSDGVGISLDVLLSEASAYVAKREGVDHFDLLEYGKGRKLVAAALAKALAEKGVEGLFPQGVALVSTRSLYYEHCYPLLEAVPGAVVVRGVR